MLPSFLLFSQQSANYPKGFQGAFWDIYPRLGGGQESDKDRTYIGQNRERTA
ncbi:hypothetical protein EZS27_020741 [termite gut metagenome]|uniref:Uncharacterized protein n=1 Tax=termite gut metagenome TaxID=433724 RepID=A0A5J4RC68_9ZZZZ